MFYAFVKNDYKKKFTKKRKLEEHQTNIDFYSLDKRF